LLRPFPFYLKHLAIGWPSALQQGGRKVLKMKTKLMGLALLAAGAMFAQPRVSVGIGIGTGPAYGSAYAAQRVIPRSPGPGYVWVEGYWSHHRGRRVWNAGYWQKQHRFNDWDRG